MRSTSSRFSLLRAALCLLALSTSLGCIGYAAKHGVRWDARDQILLSEESQVKVRNAQSRVFDTTDRIAMVEAIVATLQDLGFQIEVLDETLGIISAKSYLPLTTKLEDRGATYMLYNEESLVVFQRSFRTFGPFFRRSDLVRLTVSVRKRNEKQLIVRAAAQHFLRPVENPKPYQRFFSALEQSLFIKRIGMSEVGG